MAGTQLEDGAESRKATVRWPAAAAGAALSPDDVTARALLHKRQRVLATLVGARPGRSARSRALVVERAYGHFFLFVPVFLGIGAGVWFSAGRDPPLAVIMFFAVAALWPAWRFRHRDDWTALAAGAAFFVPVGMLLAAFETARLDTVILDSPVTTQITGRILARESNDKGAIRYRIALETTQNPMIRRPPEVVTALARGGGEPIAIGSGIAGTARLSPPSGPALAGLNDFAFNAYFSGMGAVGFFYRPPVAIDVGEADVMTRLGQRIATWRASLTDHIRGRIGGDAGAIAAALVTAEQRTISEETIEAMRQAGLAHVLAISGLNMVLAAGTFMVGARMLLAVVPGFAERYPAKKIAALGALVMVTLYILVSGGAISAVRSWIMICIMLIAVLFNRSAISLRNVALSAILILAVTPSAVTNAGFQMSYAATLGLIAGYAAWRERPYRPEGAPGLSGPLTGAFGRFLGGLILSSLIGGFSTLIYSIGHFHRIPAYGLIGNIVAMPVISIVVMPFGLLAMLLMPFGLDALPFAIMGKGIDCMVLLAKWVAGWEGEIVTGRIAPSVFLLVALGGGLACILRTRLRLTGLAMVLAGALAGLAGGAGKRPELLVSEDGRLVAMLTDGPTLINRTKPPDFIYAQWRRALGLGEMDTPAMRKTAGLLLPQDTPSATPETRYPRRKADREKAAAALVAALDAARRENRFVCERRAFCAGVSPSGWRVVTLDEPAFLGTACDGADLVVISLPLRIEACRSGATLVTARHLRKTGALEIYPTEEGRLDSGPQQGRKSAFASAVVRPSFLALDRAWSRHRAYDWRSDSFLPDIVDQ